MLIESSLESGIAVALVLKKTPNFDIRARVTLRAIPCKASKNMPIRIDLTTR